MIPQDNENITLSDSGQAQLRPSINSHCVAQQSHLRWFYSVVHNNNTSFARAFFIFEESLSTVLQSHGFKNFTLNSKTTRPTCLFFALPMRGG